MPPRKDVSSRDILVAVGALAMLGTLAYLLVRALTGYDLADAANTPGADIIIRDRVTLLPWVSGALLGGLAVLVGWWLTRRAVAGDRTEAEERARALEAERDRVIAQRDQVARERDEAAQQRDQVARERDEAHQRAEQASRETEEVRRAGEAELHKEHELRARIQRARQAERDWNRELRVQVLQMHRERGALGAHDDIRDLVLRIALEMLGAEKGLLLSRADADGDGKLDMVSVYGFDADPSDSHLAQRFAEEVIERDQTVRDDAQASSRTVWSRSMTSSAKRWARWLSDGSASNP